MRFSTVIAVMAGAAMIPLTACSDKSQEKVATENESANSLAQAIKSAGDLSVLTGALASTQLAGVFDGPAEYTVLAPSDDAFGKLGDGEGELAKPENKAAMAALLRDHILPGAITPQDVEKSLTAAKGEPISMATMGSGSVTFAKEGDKLVVTSADGQKALLGSPIRARNGVIIPVDTVLKQWTAAQ